MSGEYYPSKLTLRYMLDQNNKDRMCLRNVYFRNVGGMKVTKVPVNYEKQVERSEAATAMIRDLLGQADIQSFDTLASATKRSVATVQKQFDGINKYVDAFQNHPSKDGVDDNIWGLVVRHYTKVLTSCGKIKPLDCGDVAYDPVSYLSEPSASAGFPYVCEGPRKKRDVVMEDDFKLYFMKFCRNIMLRSDGEFLDYRTETYPCVCYQKTSVTKPEKEEKVRFIWGYPVLMTILEGLFSIPLIEHCKLLEAKNADMFTSFLMQPYSGQYEVLQQRYGHAPTLVIDYSTYDSTVPHWVIEEAFSIVEKVFELDRRYIKLFDVVRHYFIHTPIILSTGTMFVKHHGIPSGSWFTNIIGSLCNALMMMYVNILGRRKPVVMKTMGDDNLTIGGRLDVDKMSKILYATFGVVVNPSKCYVGRLTGAKFLGRVFSQEKNAFRGWKKDKVDSVISLMYPSKNDNNSRLYQRLMALYLDNPCTMFWNLVNCHREEIVLAYQDAFDIENSRDTVFTVFHGDYDLAKRFMSDFKIEKLMVKPKELEKMFMKREAG